MNNLKLHSQNLKSVTSPIQKAGGSVDVLLNQEVLGFLETLAQNGVSLTAKFSTEHYTTVEDWIAKITRMHIAFLQVNCSQMN